MAFASRWSGDVDGRDRGDGDCRGGGDGAGGVGDSRGGVAGAPLDCAPGATRGGWGPPAFSPTLFASGLRLGSLALGVSLSDRMGTVSVPSAAGFTSAPAAAEAACGGRGAKPPGADALDLAPKAPILAALLKTRLAAIVDVRARSPSPLAIMSLATSRVSLTLRSTIFIAETRD